MKVYYPAVFIAYEKGYTVLFPDLPGCVTQGDSLEEAFEMAEDAACGWILTTIEDGEDVPSPSMIDRLVVEEGFSTFVVLDIGEYAKKHSTKAIKKTLTIPEWLNTLAEQEGINFSQELQNALKVRLGLAPNGIDECVTTLQESTESLKQAITAASTAFTKTTEKATTSQAFTNNTIQFPRNRIRQVN